MRLRLAEILAAYKLAFFILTVLGKSSLEFLWWKITIKSLSSLSRLCDVEHFTKVSKSLFLSCTSLIQLMTCQSNIKGNANKRTVIHIWTTQPLHPEVKMIQKMCNNTTCAQVTVINEFSISWWQDHNTFNSYLITNWQLWVSVPLNSIWQEWGCII